MIYFVCFVCVFVNRVDIWADHERTCGSTCRNHRLDLQTHTHTLSHSHTHMSMFILKLMISWMRVNQWNVYYTPVYYIMLERERERFNMPFLTSHRLYRMLAPGGEPYQQQSRDTEAEICSNLIGRQDPPARPPTGRTQHQIQRRGAD